MGVESITIELKDKANKSDINKAFEAQRIYDASYNGHRDGYSGDFQTVNKVDFRYLGEIFPNFDKAFDFCLSKAEKWETVIAVYYKTKEGKINTLIAGWGAC